MIDQILVEHRQLIILLSEIEVAQLDPRCQRLCVVDDAGGFEDGAGFGCFEEIDLDAQGVSRGDEVAVFHVAGFF